MFSEPTESEKTSQRSFTRTILLFIQAYNHEEKLKKTYHPNQIKNKKEAHNKKLTLF